MQKASDARQYFICLSVKEGDIGIQISIKWKPWYLAIKLPVIWVVRLRIIHYRDVIMGAMAPQITSLGIFLLNRLFKHRSKKTSKFRVTGLCDGNSQVTGKFPAQRASNAENVSIWWLLTCEKGAAAQKPHDALIHYDLLHHGRFMCTRNEDVKTTVPYWIHGAEDHSASET